MSAYIVSDATIDALVTFAKSGSWTMVEGTEQAIGDLLVAENYKSVNYRYGETDEPHKYTYHFMLTPANQTPVVILKLCANYEYQACEHPEWEASKAHDIIKRIEAKAIRELPGYDDAPWGLYERQRTTGAVRLSALCR